MRDWPAYCGYRTVGLTLGPGVGASVGAGVGGTLHKHVSSVLHGPVFAPALNLRLSPS